MSANELIQLFGVLYFVFGLSLIFNKKYYSKVFIDLVKSTSYMLIAWFAALVIGFVMVISFNDFTLSKEWLISVIWAISFIKWATILLFPHFFSKIAKSFTKAKYFNLMWFTVIVLSILLMYLGFIG